MDLQLKAGRRQRSARLLAAAVVAANAGCGTWAGRSDAQFARVQDIAPSRFDVFESKHARLQTTLRDAARIAPIMATLEAGWAAYAVSTGTGADESAARADVFVFATRKEWAAFTRGRLGPAAALYLQLDRGGYTADRYCAIRDQGESATLRIVAHEGFHLFVTGHFRTRPPAFIEEGLATQFESVRDEGAGICIEATRNAAREAALARRTEAADAVPPLRTLLAMRPSDVVGRRAHEADDFYAYAWAFVRFAECGDAGLQAALGRLLADARRGALPSAEPSADPALVERYLGRSLEALDPSFDRFVRSLAGRRLRDE